MVKPITPKEVGRLKDDIIPDVIIEIFNELIVENLNSLKTSSTVLQKDVVSRIEKRAPKLREKLFAKGMLDVEDLYRKQGWDVEYDKPAYCESYEAIFRFRCSKG